MSDEKAVKPGVKTSEFWICSVVAVIGAIAGFLPPEVEGEPTTLEIIRQSVGFHPATRASSQSSSGSYHVARTPAAESS